MREAAEGKPVAIGLLQRYAVDAQMATGKQPFTRAAARPASASRSSAPGRRASPARMRSRVAGHEVVDLRGAAEGRPASTNTASPPTRRRTISPRARPRSSSAIGGIEVKTGVALGRDITLDDAARSDYDAVFLGLGLPRRQQARPRRRGHARRMSTTPSPSSPTCGRPRISPTLPVGRRVVVIGGGMTAVDAAVQAKRLGAELVTIAYRRGLEDMKASRYEHELAQTNGVTIRPWARPIALEGHDGAVSRRRVRAHALRGRQARRDGRAVPARSRRGAHRHRPDAAPADAVRRDAAEAARAARSSSTRSAARACRRSGPAAIASPAART